MSFGGNRFNDSNQNILSQMQLSLMKALNNIHKLPEYILVISDKDLIEYLNFKAVGVAPLYGEWIEWLCNSMNEMLNERFPSNCH